MDASRTQRSLGAAFDPRRKIYRDPFNEAVVFIVSATGAAVVVPLILLVVGSFTGEFSLLTFVGASALLELVLIFGLTRPQMKPVERLGWAALWAFAAAALGAAFWALVFSTVL